jgi:hypothetical protein
MRISTLVACTLALVLWVGVGVRAEGKGKGKAGGEAASGKVRETKPVQGQGVPPAGDRNAGQGVGKPGRVEKQTGPQSKKAGPASGASEKGKGQAKGKDHEQQAQAFQKQQQHELAKHMERQARLNRIREIAVQKGDTEMIARVDKLIVKEQGVYGRKLQRLQGQARAAQPLPANVAKPAPGPAGKKTRNNTGVNQGFED